MASSIENTMKQNIYFRPSVLEVTNVLLHCLADTMMLLSRTFDRPHIAGARLQENIDNLLMAIMGKLKSKSRGPTVFHFHHECFRVLFGGKGRHSGDGKSMMLER